MPDSTQPPCDVVIYKFVQALTHAETHTYTCVHTTIAQCTGCKEAARQTGRPAKRTGAQRERRDRARASDERERVERSLRSARLVQPLNAKPDEKLDS